MPFPINIYRQYVLTEGHILRKVRGDFNEEMYIRGAMAGMSMFDEGAALKAEWTANLMEGRSPLNGGNGSLPMISQVEWHWCTEDIELVIDQRYLFHLTGEDMFAPRQGRYVARTNKGLLTYYWDRASANVPMFANMWARLPGPPPVKVDEYYEQR